MEQLSFERLKAALLTKTTLGYFNPKKPTSIFIDGSPIGGLGAVVTQEEDLSKEVTPLHYASCPLTPTQARYSKIDLEALSIYWAVKRFHLFVYGKEFKVITDHKPLVLSSMSASAIIPKLDQLFSTFKAPRVVKSDNGPPFNGEGFTKFACVRGVKH